MSKTTTNQACLAFAEEMIALEGRAISYEKKANLFNTYFAHGSPHWKKYSVKFLEWYDRFVSGEMTIKDNDKIFSWEGNTKLPFLSFSTLPALTCTGAGACLDFCYSFKSWRNVHPFFRQLRNTLLMFHSFETIEQELLKTMRRKKYKSLEAIDFRLYVDGDFSSIKDVVNWMRVIRENPRLSAYGYSKSWHEMLLVDVMQKDTGMDWPDNYVLNLSNGGKWDGDAKVMKAMSALKCTRNAFKAIRLKNSFNINTPEYRKELTGLAKAEGMTKVFICNGSCATCTPKGHACGMASLNAPVVIGIH